MALLAPQAHSQQKSAWAFYDVKLSEIVRVGLSQLLDKSFVADDALIRDERRVSLDLKQDQSAKAGPLLIDLLLEYGYTVTEVNGLWKIRKSTEKDKEDGTETLIYRPKFRSASYFYDVLGFGKNSSSSGNSAGLFSASNGKQSSESLRSNDSKNSESSTSATSYIDRSSDVVYLRGTANQIRQYNRLINELDTAEEQVDITASVYEFQATEGTSTALGAVINLAKGKITGQIGAVTAVADFLRLDTGSLQVLFSMLAEDKRFNLISSPNVRVKSGSSSRISVGASVPTLASTTQSNGQVTQSVAYQLTGIILDVNASIYQQTIDLKINQSISEAINTSTGVNASPTLTKREVQTSINMIDGESVVLGGLTSTKSSAGRSGLAFLPRMFDSKDKNESRTELLIFLKVAKSKSSSQAIALAPAPSP
jgi:general secretion pathway protein D